MLWIWLAVIANLLLLSYFYGDLDTKRRRDGMNLADAISALNRSQQEMQRQIDEMGSELITLRERIGYEEAQNGHAGKLPPLYPALYNENGIVPRVFNVKTGLARSVRDLENGLQGLKSDLHKLAEAPQPLTRV
jgi:hypothetical protein